LFRTSRCFLRRYAELIAFLISVTLMAYLFSLALLPE
jgi:hypothetical protein